MDKCMYMRGYSGFKMDRRISEIESQRIDIM